MNPEQLKVQAQKRAAAASPHGIAPAELPASQLIKGAEEELMAQQNIVDQQEAAKQAVESEQVRLQELGLAPAPAKAIPASMPTIASEIVPNPQQMAQQQVAQPVQKPDQASGLIQSALAEQTKGSAQAIAATDTLMKDWEAKQAEFEKNKAAALAKTRQDIEDNEKKIANFEWDNRSIWEKSSTAGKIALAIGGFLSSLSPGSAQAFRDSVDKTLQSDLNAQKERYNALKERGRGLESYYGQLVQQFGSEQAADFQIMNMKLGMINNKLRVTADTAQSKIVAANALQGQKLVESQILENKAQVFKLAEETSSRTVPGFEGAVKDPASLRGIQERVAAKNSAELQIKNLEDMLKQGATIPFSKNKQLAEQTRKALAADLSKAMFGRSSDAELAVAMELIPDITSLGQRRSVDQAMLNNLRKKLNSDVSAAARSVGLRPSGETIGRTKP